MCNNLRRRKHDSKHRCLSEQKILECKNEHSCQIKQNKKMEKNRHIKLKDGSNLRKKRQWKKWSKGSLVMVLQHKILWGGQWSKKYKSSQARLMKTSSDGQNGLTFKQSSGKRLE